MARVDNRGNWRGSAANAPGAVSVKGAENFLALSKALKKAGETELRKELNKVMRDAAKPLIPKVRQAARDKLPKHGGLNERIARKPLRAQTRTGANTAGVRIVGSKVDPRINAGRVQHPTFGHKPTVVQQVPGAVGYFDETLSKEGPAIRQEMFQALDQFTNRIVRERG